MTELMFLLSRRQDQRFTGTSIRFIGTDTHRYKHIGTFAQIDHDWAHVLVEQTSRLALYCRWWDKHLLGSGLSKTVVWFSSKESCRWLWKVTAAERLLLLCERKLQHGKIDFHVWCGANFFDWNGVTGSRRPVAFFYDAVKHILLAFGKQPANTGWMWHFDWPAEWG